MRLSRFGAAVLAVLGLAWPAGAAAVPAVAAAAPAPAPAGPGWWAEPHGWQPVFATDFSDGRLPEECTAFDAPPVGQAANYYRPDETQISGGMLRLSIRRRDFGDWPYTSGGAGCPSLAQQYGRYEFRAKAAPGTGVESYFVLWPENRRREDATVLEIAAAQRGPETAYLSNGYGPAVARKDIPGSFARDFHDYVIEWAPSGLRILIDEQVRFADSRVSAQPRWFGFALGTGGEHAGLPERNQLPAELLVDWLRMYTYHPGESDEEPAQALSAVPPVSSSSAAVAPTAGDPDADGAHRLRWVGAVAAALFVAVIVAFVVYAVSGRLRPGRLRRGQAAHRA